uniref:Phosphoribosylaminoimidazole-succinocarboxamide synthase, chloroplastic n=1 Tax=Elaeis guineensis var. tenera TaxID=51953 RepID=A0A6I9SF10_ELAGV|nr:phosphoribosylaminoimidazole-succinocarboxamide synthase, chloroplastic isoform X1 [Elaeis guineensis]
MAFCVPPATQNPPKTLQKTPFLPSFSRSLRLSMARPSRPTPSNLSVGSKTQIRSAHDVSLLSADARHRDDVLCAARSALSNCLSETHLDRTVPGLTAKARGKVRDIYDGGDHVVLVTTDRQSAFDRVLASIPFKGQVLNETSLWWFNKTRHITPNAVVSTPDKNVTIAKKCAVFPVEFVVRGFVSGSTDTSLWTVYSKGVRNYCGNVLPEGLVKNQKLPANILTPTTKATDHDVPVSPNEIIKLGLMTHDEYDEVSSKALSLFAYGQQVALENGLLLVDTKYEFGKGADGTIMLIDEVHTPDSSRYWIANSYEKRFNSGLEPENVDKEFLRLWFKDHCNPYEDKVSHLDFCQLISIIVFAFIIGYLVALNSQVLPEAPEELVCELAWRYIFLFETITNSNFELPRAEEPVHDRISRNVSQALSCI